MQQTGKIEIEHLQVLMSKKQNQTGPQSAFASANGLQNRIEVLYDDVVSWRRHLHRNPELSFQEFDTTRWIVEKLEKWGYEVHRPCDTGCVAVLKGDRRDENGTGNTVALRADIDALPIQEEGEAKSEFLSEKDGVAHCCGHDLHTANLLGTALLLAEQKSAFSGKVVLIFQAGEEVLPGGGRLLAETGILEELEVSEVYGLHTDPRHNPGQVAVKKGPMMASPYEFTVEVRGKGGHAAAPHQAVDPIVISAQIIQQLQTIVSRYTDPADAAVVTVSKINAGTARNIIPGYLMLEGTIRTFNEGQTKEIFDRIESICSHAAASAGGSAKCELITGYPPVINHPETTEKFINLAGDVLVSLEKQVMAGEDFSFYQKKIPGTFFLLGSGSDEAASRYSWHHPRYNVDERCLKTGMRVMASLVLQDVAKNA